MLPQEFKCIFEPYVFIQFPIFAFPSFPWYKYKSEPSYFLKHYFIWVHICLEIISMSQSILGSFGLTKYIDVQRSLTVHK